MAGVAEGNIQYHDAKAWFPLPPAVRPVAKLVNRVAGRKLF